MISKKIQDKLNDQLNKELFSSYLYLYMSAHCRSISLDGCAHWLRLQADEEREHAMKFFDYIEEQQGTVVLGSIAEPRGKFRSVQEVFEKVLEHEKYVTKSINQIMEFAVQEKDFATQNFLQWFIKEQVEEESSAQQALDRFKLAGDSMGAVLQLDRELSKRKED